MKNYVLLRIIDNYLRIPIKLRIIKLIPVLLARAFIVELRIYGCYNPCLIVPNQGLAILICSIKSGGHRNIFGYFNQFKSCSVNIIKHSKQ